MDIMSFVMSLSTSQTTTPPEPEEELTDLVLSSDPATVFTGDQVLSGVTGNYIWSPRKIWANGKTYDAISTNPNLPDTGIGYIQMYDENRGILRPYRVTSPNILNPYSGLPDGHTVCVIQVDDDGNIFIFQERPHDTPIDIYKGSSVMDFERLAEQINPGTGAAAESSYHNMIKLDDGNGWSWCRMTGLFEAYAGGHGASVEAADGFESWGALNRNTTNPRPAAAYPPSGTTNTRHYPQLPYSRQVVGDYIYLLRTQRVDDYVDSLGQWHKYYIHRTPKGTGRGVLFENLLGTPYTHDITGANYMTETILDDNFLYHNSGSHLFNSYAPVATVSLHPKVYIITGEGNTTNLVMHIIDVQARTQVTKPLNLTGYYPYGIDVQEHAVRNLAYNEEGQYLEAAVEMDHGGGIIKCHILRSYNESDSWIDRGDITPEIATSVNRVTFPMNYSSIPRNRNFTITMNSDLDPVEFTRTAYIKRCAKNAIQTETPPVIVPAASFSDAANVFDYIAVDSAITRSGNNVTALINQFSSGAGLVGNANGVNNPQWDGTDIITLNGTNQFFAATSITPITTQTKATFFAVVRRNTANKPIIFSISDNTSTLRYIAFVLSDSAVGDAVSYRYGNNVKNIYEHGQYVPALDEWVLVSWSLDGRTKVDIHVNGMKQYYESFNYASLAEYNNIRGRMDYGTVNAVQFGRRDLSGAGDLYSAFQFKRLMMKNIVYDYETYRALEKKIADAHGITLNYGYQ